MSVCLQLQGHDGLDGDHDDFLDPSRDLYQSTFRPRPISMLGDSGLVRHGTCPIVVPELVE
jgi:hypothetical protein